MKKLGGVMKSSKTCALVAVAVTSILLVARPAVAQVRHLPLNDFLSVQFAQVCWTDPASPNVLCFDLYGARAAIFGLDLGTTFNGDVQINDLGNGRERVIVNWQTRGANCAGFTDAGPALGYLPIEVAGGAPPVLGDGHTIFQWTQPTGSGMPTQAEIFDDPTGARVAEKVQTSVMCHGQLRAGSGYPEGTPGLGATTQVGNFHSGVPTGCPPEKDADCFPAEKVQFKANGQH
jgi:hypothetical protein